MNQEHLKVLKIEVVSAEFTDKEDQKSASWLANEVHFHFHLLLKYTICLGRMV